MAVISGRGERESNLEALRIVSMLMVLAVHADGASLGLPLPKGELDALTASEIWRTVVESLAIIGVNCFTMISGYFGISLRPRKVMAFLGIALFYSCGIYLVFCAANPAEFSWGKLGEYARVITCNDLWYVPAYFALMIVAPCLNWIAAEMPWRGFSMLVFALVWLNVFLGWGLGMEFNPTGYTVVQLIMMYMLGRWLGMCPRPGRVAGYVALGVYVLAAWAVAVSSLHIESSRAYAYNSPAVLVESIALFLFFTSLQFRSVWVNRLAASAFAVYLIHKHPIVWVRWMKPTVINLWNSMGLTAFTFSVIGMIAGIYLTCHLIDRARRLAVKACSIIKTVCITR